jgi:hypothetical protein
MGPSLILYCFSSPNIWQLLKCSTPVLLMSFKINFVGSENAAPYRAFLPQHSSLGCYWPCRIPSLFGVELHTVCSDGETSHVFALIWPNSDRWLVNHCEMPSIGQTWVLASIGAVIEMGILSTLKRLLMEFTVTRSFTQLFVLRDKKTVKKSTTKYLLKSCPIVKILNCWDFFLH